MNTSFKTLIFCLVILQIKCHSGVYKHPEGCNVCDFTLEWDNSGSETSFKFTAQTDGDAQAYAAFALSTDKRMGSDDVHVCRTGSVNKIEHYFNPKMHQRSVLMDRANPSVGFSSMRVTNINNKIICSFKRKNSMKGTKNYFDLSKQYFLLFAHGRFGNSLQYHNARVSSARKLFI